MTLLAVLAGGSGAAARETADPPPNAPATVNWDAGQGRLSLQYHGNVILDAAIRAEDAQGNEVKGAAVKLEPKEALGDKAEQRLRFVPARPQGGVSLSDMTGDARRKVLSGKSGMVVGDPCVLTVHLPGGFRLERAEADGEEAEAASQAGIATVKTVLSASKMVEWTMVFAE